MQTELLYEKAIHEAHLTGKERVIDAYCGTGTIGIIAAKNAGEVIGVELNRDAIRDQSPMQSETTSEISASTMTMPENSWLRWHKMVRKRMLS